MSERQQCRLHTQDEKEEHSGAAWGHDILDVTDERVLWVVDGVGVHSERRAGHHIHTVGRHQTDIMEHIGMT